MGLTVVKLGGSLGASGRLHRTLEELGRHRGAPFVIVPGGGEYADAVRACQQRDGFSDSAAHEMALLAMQSFGRAIVDLLPGAELVVRLADVDPCIARGALPVCVPVAELLASSLPASWDLTSDSIAAWVAARLRASRILLIKSASCPSYREPRELADAGVVDPLFPRYASVAACPVVMAGADDDLRAVLADFFS